MDEAPSGARPIGQVYAYEGGTSPRALVSGVRIANSIAFSPDGRRMYFADTPTKIIRCYDYDLDSGDLSAERTFAAPQGPGAPDGSTVDADGCLWNAEWGGGRVVRYTPDGRVDRAVALPCSQVTCCAFGGARLDRLYVTTARIGLDAPARRMRARCSSSTPASRASPIPRFPPRVRHSRFERSALRSSGAAVFAVAARRHLRL